MCMEDVRLGRKTKDLQHQIALTVASQQVLDRSPLRRIVVLFPPPSGTTTYSTLNPVVASAGIVIPAASPAVVLKVDDVGDIVTKEWFGIHSAGGVTATIVEGLLEAE